MLTTACRYRYPHYRLLLLFIFLPSFFIQTSYRFFVRSCFFSYEQAAQAVLNSARHTGVKVSAGDSRLNNESFRLSLDKRYFHKDYTQDNHAADFAAEDFPFIVFQTWKKNTAGSVVPVSTDIGMICPRPPPFG